MNEQLDRTGSSDRDTTDAARQQSRQVQGTAQDAASNVAGSAQQRGRDVRRRAEDHVRGIANDAGEQLRGHAREETQRAGSALQSAGSHLQALAEGRVDDAGVFGDYAQQAADTVNRWADEVQDRGFDGLLDDLRSYGRRRPGAFLLGALAAGVIASRFGRNAAQELRDSDGDSGTSAQSMGGTGTQHDAGSDDVIVGTSADADDASRSRRGGDDPARVTVESDRGDTALVDERDDEVVVAERPSGDVVVEDPDTGEDIPYEPMGVEQRRMP